MRSQMGSSGFNPPVSKDSGDVFHGRGGDHGETARDDIRPISGRNDQGPPADPGQEITEAAWPQP